MIFKKDLKKSLDNLSDGLKNLSANYWETLATITRKSQIMASDTAFNFNANSAIFDGINNEYNGTTYNMIQQMRLPSYMAWDFWVMVNQWADYWVNRYTNFNHEHKEDILNAVRIACLYGIAGVDKENYQAYFITNYNTPDANYLCYPVSVMFNSSAIGTKDGALTISQKAKQFEQSIPRDRLVVFTWRFNQIGDYIWCMKDILTDIYLKKIIECNLSQLTNKQFYKVKNPEAFITEAQINTNPFKNYGVIFSDDENTIPTVNSLIDNNKTDSNPHMDSLIMGYKQHVEYYYNKYGRVITSSKQQSLSSDANLNVSSAELIADEHDRRITDALERLGINLIDINEVEPNEQPQNDNADKEGAGIANTNGEAIDKGKEDA